MAHHLHTAAWLLLVTWCCLVLRGDARPKDVLFFAIDDLRPQLGCYGHEQMKTPNIDSLASRSLVFENAYCQVAVCSPSRASLLTGRRPDTNHVWLIAPDEYWRHYTNATTIPQYFKENGYVSAGMGKVFHPGAPSGNDDIAYSWSVPYYHSPLQGPYGVGNKTAASWAFQGFEDNQLPDGQIADNAVSTLQEIRQNRSKGDDTPFFLAVGFHKPHLPFYAPAIYYDLYPPASDFKLADNQDAPQGMPSIAYSTANSLTMWNDVKAVLPDDWDQCHNDPDQFNSKQCRIPDDMARQLRRAYSACISYTDAQVGRVMSELEKQGLADNTIIVLWADHGWQLGEHNEWCKFTNFEDATHVPFMLRVPGVTDQGSRTKALVELIDIFPTLTELAGIKKPPLCPEIGKDPLACVEGTSVAPLLQDPTQEWKKAAFSQYPRPASGFHQIPGHPPFVSDHGENVMGYTMRVDSYRYTEWVSFDRDTATPNWDNGVLGVELYNHTDPTIFFNDENVNMADMPSMKSVVAELHQVLKAGWRSALPPNADHR